MIWKRLLFAFALKDKILEGKSYIEIQCKKWPWKKFPMQIYYNILPQFKVWLLFRITSRFLEAQTQQAQNPMTGIVEASSAPGMGTRYPSLSWSKSTVSLSVWSSIQAAKHDCLNYWLSDINVNQSAFKRYSRYWP